MATRPTTVKEYLDALPADRRQALEEIRRVIRANIDPDFEEGMQYGMPSWYLPHSKYPNGYHCDPKQPLPFASIASQKNHIGLYLFCIYCDGEAQARFVEEWKDTGKRLDMGKSCVRVKKLEDIPLEVVGRAFKRMTAKKFVAGYEASLNRSGTNSAARATGGKTTAKKATAKKPTAKKPAAKKSAAKPRTAAKKKAAPRRRT